MLASALLRMRIGAITMDETYQAIEWRSIFLIATMLPKDIPGFLIRIARLSQVARVRVTPDWQIE